MVAGELDGGAREARWSSMAARGKPGEVGGGGRRQRGNRQRGEGRRVRGDADVCDARQGRRGGDAKRMDKAGGAVEN
jgi:hypothetical protein